MLEQQRYVDSQCNAGFDGDPGPWVSTEVYSSPTHSRTQSSFSSTTAGAAGNVDRDLYKDLVEMIPLVQSLIDQKPSSSFTRRGSVIYTKTPSREPVSKKMSELKGKNAAQCLPTQKRRDSGDKDDGKLTDSIQNCAQCSSASATENDREDFNLLREQIEDLQKKLVEKDELLSLAEITKTQVATTQARLDELKQHAVERDSLLKSTQLKLSDAKVKLADKQAALEKIQWEAQTSTSKAEKLLENLQSTQGEISFLMNVFDGLTNNDSSPATFMEDSDELPQPADYLPEIDDMDEMKMQEMEEARRAYVDAVNAAKEKQDEESMAVAGRARARLHSCVFQNIDHGKNQQLP